MLGEFRKVNNKEIPDAVKLGGEALFCAIFWGTKVESLCVVAMQRNSKENIGGIKTQNIQTQQTAEYVIGT